jgi:hypothetical protein
MFGAKDVKPLIHHIVIVSIFCITSLVGNALNNYHISFYSGYALAVIWCVDHYKSKKVLHTYGESALFNLSHASQMLSAICSIVFAATVRLNRNTSAANKHIRSQVM